MHNPLYLVMVVINDAEIESGMAYGTKIALPIFYEAPKVLLRRRTLK
jgi:hypothetical protein